MVHDVSRTSTGAAPNPGTSRGGALGVNGGRWRARRRANGTGAPARSAGVREGCPEPEWPKASCAGDGGRRAKRQGGGEHGHELKIRRPGGVCARALARRRVAALPPKTARGRRDGAGRGSANAQVTGPLRRRPRPEGGGRAVPESWFEPNETRIARTRARSTSETIRSCSCCSSTRSSPPTRSRAFASDLSGGASTG